MNRDSNLLLHKSLSTVFLYQIDMRKGNPRELKQFLPENHVRNLVFDRADFHLYFQDWLIYQSMKAIFCFELRSLSGKDELTFVEGLLKIINELAPEYFGKGSDGKMEVFVGARYPLFFVEGERSGRYNAMYV